MTAYEVPSLRQLRAFEAVARLESISAAARDIHLSQPGVSQAIREELLFRADVVAVAPGSLPRFEMKAKRVIHE